MKILVVNCFNFTLGTTGIIDGKDRVKIDRVDADSIYSTARNFGVTKISLIGPKPITQKIQSDLLLKYSFIETEILPK